MNTKQKREKVKSQLVITSTEVWQDRPYTAVKVVATFGISFYTSYGFAKVQWKDDWDEEYGVGMAIDKAVGKIVKEILEVPSYHEWASNDEKGLPPIGLASVNTEVYVTY